MILVQETSWAYSAMLPSTKGALSICWTNGGLLQLRDRMGGESRGGTRRGGKGQLMGRGWKGRRRK